ncbi:Holliday junction resolvase RuvX [Candidatus Uhrbacteria bacterium]|nr:Holliday junction resolvase RuvX [Candidatus Uhrbacteria bacterium]
MNRVLGIDFGTKRIGLAFGDVATCVAVPLETLDVKGQDAVVRIAEIVTRDHYDHVVVGLPLDADAKDSPMSERVRAFASRLQEATHVPVSFVSEYLTSKSAEDLARREGLKGHDDALAAMLIVEAFLNGGETTV